MRRSGMHDRSRAGNGASGSRRRRRRGASPVVVVATVALSILVTACGKADLARPADEGMAADLAGREFVATAVTQAGSPQQIVAGTQVLVSFGVAPSSSATGSTVAIGLDAGCNRIGGTATLVPAGTGRSVLRVDDLMSTEMACAPAVMAQEDLYARLLRGRPTVSLDGSRLVIEGTPVPADAASPRSGALRVTMADRRAQTPDQTLVGPRWRVDGLVSGSGPDASVSSVPAGATAWLQLDKAGRMTLNAGCNTGNASVTVTGGPTTGSMVIGPVATTRKACPPPASDVERHVLGVLQGTVAWTVTGASLSLDGATSGLRLRVG